MPPKIEKVISPEADLLITERNDVFALAQAIYDNLSNATPDTVSNFRSSFDRLEAVEQDFKAVTARIRQFNVTVSTPADRLDTSKAYAAFVGVIDAAKTRYLTAARSTTPKVPQEQSTSTSSEPQVCNSYNKSCLPRIQLPKFGGNIEFWTEYISLFTSLVDSDSSLSAIQKFQYLRSSLFGDALAVISGFSLEADNYPLACEALKRRYHNKRRLASNYIDKILNFQTSSKSSTAQLQKFLNVHENSVNALKSLGITDLGDFVLLQLALNNLDAETRSKFEEHQSSQTIPSYRDLMEFVTECRRKAELLPVAKNNSRSEPEARQSPSGKSNLSSHQPSLISTVQSAPSQAVSVPPPRPSRKEPAGENLSKPKSPPRELPPEKKVAAVALKCWNCGKGAHAFSKCPEPRRRFCYRCGKPGVVVVSCPNCSPGNP